MNATTRNQQPQNSHHPPSVFPSTSGQEQEPGQESAQAAPAAQARVTAQEFAQAMAALETRSESVKDTLPIGEALQQLGMVASAEEVWAEVQAQRERQARAHEARVRRTRGRRAAGWGVAAAVFTCLSGLALFGHRSAGTSAGAFGSESPYPPSQQQGMLRTLAEVPDGQMVQAEPGVVKLLLKGKPAQSPAIIVRDLGAHPVRDLGAHPPNGSWFLIKHGGQVYVRGYIAAMSPRVMSSLPQVRIYSQGLDNTHVDGLAYLTPITLRIGSFTWHGMDTEELPSNIRVSNLQPDAHVNEQPEF